MNSRRDRTAARRTLRSLAGRSVCERGQSVVEFALVIPLIVVLVLALYGGGKVLFYWNNAGQVANEGARMLSVNAKTFPGGVSFEDYLESHAATLGSDAAATIVVEFDDVDGFPAGTAGSAATVWVCRDYEIPFVSDITIAAKATMRLERNVTITVPTGTGC